MDTEYYYYHITFIIITIIVNIIMPPWGNQTSSQSVQHQEPFIIAMIVKLMFSVIITFTSWPSV